MARPLGRGDKGLAIKERRTIFGIPFLILFPFENINYFTLDNLSKYIWTYHVKVFVLGRRKKCPNRFRLCYEKILLQFSSGAGQGLYDRAIKKITFFVSSRKSVKKMYSNFRGHVRYSNYINVKN